MKKLLIIFLLIPTLAISGTFKDEEGKFGLKTKRSGFKFHLNFMDHNDYNFQYIKDKTKARAGKYYQRFEVRDGDCFGNDGWNDCKTNRERVEFSGKPSQRPKNIKCYGYSLMLSKDFIRCTPQIRFRSSSSKRWPNRHCWWLSFFSTFNSN